MFPLLLAPLFKGITGMVGGSSKLAEGASKTAMKAAVLSASEDDRVQGNLPDSDDDSDGKKEKSEKKSMFGGLDLGRIKSAIGDSGEMGPMQEVKGGVYKQIFEVNKSMLSSLQRMETTMKLLLEVEYERIKGMVSLDASEKLEKGDTDKKTKEGKPGLLSKAAKGAGKVLGGIKGGLGGNIGKLLGLGGLLFLFKNFEEEVKVAVQKMLKFFGDVYLYFTADDFTFAQFKEDLVSKFLPKLREMSFNILDFIWGAIKGVANEWLFGTKGDKRIKEELSANVKPAQQNLTKMTENLKGFEDMTVFQTTSKEFKDANPDFTKKDRANINKQHVELIEAFQAISQASSGRIQFTGIQDLNGRFSASDIASVTTIGAAMNAQPIVDGEIKDFKFLETINLAKSGGITKGMDDDKVDEINSALADKTSLMQQYVKIKNMPLQKSMFGFGINDEAERKLELDRLDKEMKNQDLIIGNTGQVFADTTATITGVDGGSAEALIKVEAEKKRLAEENAKDNAKNGGLVSIQNEGAKTFVDAKQQMIVPLSTQDAYQTAAFANIRTT